MKKETLIRANEIDREIRDINDIIKNDGRVMDLISHNGTGTFPYKPYKYRLPDGMKQDILCLLANRLSALNEEMEKL